MSTNAQLRTCALGLERASMNLELSTILRRSGLAMVGMLCCAALPAAVLRYSLEMPAKVEPGDEWLPWLFIGFIVVDLAALALLLRFRRHWAAWVLAVVSGIAPFLSIYLTAR